MGTNIFFGEISFITKAVAAVEAYSIYGSRFQLDDFSAARRYHAGAANARHAIFAGGYNTTTLDSLEIYNTSTLYKESTDVVDTLTSKARYLAGVSTEKYAVFAGGIDTSNKRPGTVQAYDRDLHKTVMTALNGKTNSLAGAEGVNHIIFAGGWTGSGNSNAVTAYEKDTLEKTNSTVTLYYARTALAGAFNGRYAVFAGGNTGSNTSGRKNVEAFDENMHRTIPAALLDTGRHHLVGVRLGNYAVFIAGDRSDKSYTTIVEAYDQHLVRCTPQELSVARSDHAAATAGEICYVAGGITAEGRTDSVEAYTLE